MAAIFLTGLCGLAAAQSGPAPTGAVGPDPAAAAVPEVFRSRPLRVVTRLIPPFVMKGDDGKLQGFSVDLWNALAARLNLKTEYLAPAPDVAALLAEVKTGQAEVGIAAVSITAERDRDVDFSQPMYESGLQIAVRDVAVSGPRRELNEIAGVLLSSTMLHLFGLMLISAVIIAHIVWLVERRHEEGGVVEHKRYIPGIFKAFWWSMGTIGSQVDEMPRTWLGRLIALFWMFCAIVFVAYFTAAATTSLTVKSLKGAIQGPGDLPGKSVAALTGSTAAAFAKQHKAKVTEVDDLAAAMKLLASGQVAAVVADAPVLQYYAANDGQGQVQLAGDVFRKEFYGIVVANDSTLRAPINTALLEMEEDGSYQALVDQWFKPDNAGG